LDPNPYPNPNPNFFLDSDSDPAKSFGFFRIPIRIRIRNTGFNHAHLQRVNIMIRKGAHAQLILHPLRMLQALPLDCFNHANLNRVKHEQ
jgi:hypothetical protein